MRHLAILAAAAAAAALSMAACGGNGDGYSRGPVSGAPPRATVPSGYGASAAWSCPAPGTQVILGDVPQGVSVALVGPPEHARALQAHARRLANAYGTQRVRGGVDEYGRPHRTGVDRYGRPYGGPVDPYGRPYDDGAGEYGRPYAAGTPADATIEDTSRGSRVILRPVYPEDLAQLRADVEAGSVELEASCRQLRDHR